MQPRILRPGWLAAVVLAVAGWGLAQAPQVSTGGSRIVMRDGGKNRAYLFGDSSVLPDARVLLKRFRMETLDDREQPELRIEAPECIYDPRANHASSSGPLKVTRADGMFRLEGEGFAWDQKTDRLTISNQVRAVIRRRLFNPANALPN